MDRQSLQLLITKLDTNAVTLKEAKAFAKRLGVESTARTKESFIRDISKKAS